MPTTPTTRSRIIYQSHAIMAHLEAIELHMKKITEIAEGKSVWIEEQLPLLVVMIGRTKDLYTAFQVGL